MTTHAKTLAIGTDQRGEEVARHVLNILEGVDCNILVLSSAVKQGGSPDSALTENEGTTIAGSLDYPEEACRVAHAVVDQRAEAGILISGSAIGMCITANKCPGIRAVVAYDEWVVRRSRAHHNCNILCIPAELDSQSNLKNLLDIWLETEFEGGRHERRINKIAVVERGETPSDFAVNA